MQATLASSFGAICRGRRIELDLTQAAVSQSLGISRSHYAAIEAARANPSIALVDRIGETLGLRLGLVASLLVVVTDPVVRDAVHARCSAYVMRRLQADGWLVLREVEIIDARLRGWIDLLAFDPRSRTLLIIEIKTSIDDIGRLERQVGWYSRAIASAVPADWQPVRVATWVLALSTADVDEAIARHRAIIDAGFPGRAASMREVLSESVAGLADRGLALIDPRSRRRDWLLSLRVDGRRAPAPYQDRAGAARILGV
jgi:transcriptional regulator with XRE-family HTH domain